MKKILSLLLIFIMLFLCVGCSIGDSTLKDSKVTEKSYDTELFDRCFAAQEITYKPFEKKLEEANLVLKATYNGMVKVNELYLLDFDIFDVLYDSANVKDLTKNTITVNYSPTSYTVKGGDTNFSYDTLNIVYEKGKEYLLFLKAYSTLYVDYVLYTPIEPSMCIALESNRDPALSNSKIYGGELSAHIKDGTLKNADGDEFVQMVLSFVKNTDFKNNPTVFDKESFETLASSAKYVLFVEIEEKNEDFGTDFYGRSYCRCKVIESFKGNTEEKISVYLPFEKVKVGQKYLIAVDEHFSGAYDINSPYAVYTLP